LPRRTNSASSGRPRFTHVRSLRIVPVTRSTVHARGVVERTYRIVVQGELGDQVATAFEGMTLTHLDGTTEMQGLVRDQSELQGLLQRVSDLGLTLLSTTTVDDEPKR
jgi:hypothetical protein